MNKHGLFSLSGLVLALGLSLSAQAAQALRVAADPLPHADILGEVKRQDPSLDLQVIELSGGINANALLVAGDVDANYFQHVPYLRDQEKALGTELVVAATVHVEPLGIYSKKFKHLREVPEKAVIALPNNVTNLSRALYLLQHEGSSPSRPAMKIRRGIWRRCTTSPPTPRRSRSWRSRRRSCRAPLDDVDLAVINGNYALEAGLEPARDALGLESAQNNPYANILVTTPALKDDPRIRQLARDLESRAIADFIRKSYKGR